MSSVVEEQQPIAVEPQPGAAPAKPGMRISWWIQLPIYAAVLGLLVVVALQMRRNGPLAAGHVGAGQKAPEFTLVTFDGQSLALADLRGQVVVVNFWASWCLPCKEEAADLENTWRRYKVQGVLFLGVDYVDTETEARAYLDEFDITYPNGPDLGTRISQSYRISGVPETYIIDQSGTLVYVKIGPITESELQAVIEPLLQ